MKINEDFLSIAKEINILEDQYIDIRGGIVFDDFEELMIILEKRSSIRTKLYSLSLDFLAKCNNNEILFKMYVQLAVMLEKEDYENAEKIKNYILNEESKIILFLNMGVNLYNSL